MAFLMKLVGLPLIALLTLMEWLGIFALAFRSSSPISWRR